MKKKHPKYFQEMSIPLFSVSDFYILWFKNKFAWISNFHIWSLQKMTIFLIKLHKNLLEFLNAKLRPSNEQKLKTLMPSLLLLLLLKSSWKRFWNIPGFLFQKCAFNYNSFSNEKMLALQLSTTEICVHLAWREAEIVVKLKIRPKHAIKVESSW